jgi:hypothetical protein
MLYILTMRTTDARSLNGDTKQHISEQIISLRKEDWSKDRVM